MSRAEQATSNKSFFKIVEGSFRRSVPAGTPDAIERAWTAGGKTGTAIEVEYKHLFGFVRNVEFYEGEGDNGKYTNLNLVLDEDEETGRIPVISVGVDTKYARDIMHKLPNIDLEKDVRIRPFSFVPEGEDKAVTGVEIMQRDSIDKFTKKVESFFFKKEGEKSVEVNGFPKREKPYDEQSKAEREISKILRNEFLANYTRENIIPKFNVSLRPPQSLEEQMERQGNYPTEEIDPSEIPF